MTIEVFVTPQRKSPTAIISRDDKRIRYGSVTNASVKRLARYIEFNDMGMIPNLDTIGWIAYTQ